jgi:hypothetical protein
LVLFCAVALGLASEAARSDDRQLMPEWHGVWHGNLLNLPATEPSPTIKVNLEIGVGDEPDDGCLTWRSTYTDDGVVRAVKDYRLCQVAGRYVIDEGGGLELEVSMFGNRLYSVFRVQDVTLVTRYEIDEDQLVQEILSMPAAGRKVETHEESDIESYAGTGLQTVEFFRYKPVGRAVE